MPIQVDVHKSEAGIFQIKDKLFGDLSQFPLINAQSAPATQLGLYSQNSRANLLIS